jgi:hypothetical protein
MNTIELTTISVASSEMRINESPIFKSFGFCDNINRILSNIKLCHLFTNNYDSHKIYGELYDTLSDLFDTLEEEIIGLLRSGPITEFPVDTVDVFTTEYDESDYYRQFKILINELFSILTFSEFQNFVENAPKNGIKNILEEIYSATNKAEYLLRLALKTVPEQVSDNSDSGIQTGISTDSPNQTYEIQPAL